jgi:hypothetical protein
MMYLQTTVTLSKGWMLGWSVVGLVLIGAYFDFNAFGFIAILATVLALLGMAYSFEPAGFRHAQ